jgi:hypothetical protein
VDAAFSAPPRSCFAAFLASPVTAPGAPLAWTFLVAFLALPVTVSVEPETTA